MRRGADDAGRGESRAIEGISRLFLRAAIAMRAVAVRAITSLRARLAAADRRLGGGGRLGGGAACRWLGRARRLLGATTRLFGGGAAAGRAAAIVTSARAAEAALAARRALAARASRVGVRRTERLPRGGGAKRENQGGNRPQKSTSHENQLQKMVKSKNESPSANVSIPPYSEANGHRPLQRGKFAVATFYRNRRR